MRPLIAIAATLLALGLLWSTQASAQVEDEEGVVTVYKRTTILDMKEVEFKGTLPGPSASYGVVKREAKFDLTIRVRQSFLPEVMKTASSL